MISGIEDYFLKGCGRCPRFATQECSTRRWADGLAALRRICLDGGLAETVKWGHPCYTRAGRNVAIIGAFRDDFRLTFFDAALMKDPDGVLEKAGPNTAHAGLIRFTDNAQPEAQAGLIARYLAEAIAYADAGVRAPVAAWKADLPEELVDALDADADLAEAFARLTRGRQRSYVINLSAAKTSATRTARIEKFRAKIIAGKGATER